MAEEDFVDKAAISRHGVQADRPRNIENHRQADALSHKVKEGGDEGGRGGRNIGARGRARRRRGSRH